jgi:hypothetical protein
MLPMKHQSWEEVRTRLDQNAPFSNMLATPYYRDAVYDHFSKQEYARRYAALREKMRVHKLDCVIVPGGPSHWSFGGGMQWLTGHWEWHAIASYVVVPLVGEPTLVFSMGGMWMFILLAVAESNSLAGLDAVDATRAALESYTLAGLRAAGRLCRA